MPFTSFHHEDDDNIHTADLDYPELAEILEKRPPPENQYKTAEKQVHDARCSLCNMNPATRDIGGTTVCESCAENQFGIPIGQEPSKFGQPKFAEKEAGFITDWLTGKSGNPRSEPGAENAWSYDWCKFRKNSHCMLPKDLDQKKTKETGNPLWIPYDRGLCPRMKWIDQASCFSGDTKFMTYDGYRTFKEVVNTTQRVLTSSGQWVEAKIESFGYQKLYQINLTRNKKNISILTTAEHRWFVLGRKRDGSPADRTDTRKERVTWSEWGNNSWINEIHSISDVDNTKRIGYCSVCGPDTPIYPRINTFGLFGCKHSKSSGAKRVYLRKKQQEWGIKKPLNVGDKLAWQLPYTYLHRWYPNPTGIQAGFVFGDGGRDYNPEIIRGNGCSVNLFGDKDAQLLKYFEYCKQSYHAPDMITRNIGYTNVSGLPSFFKSRPSLDESAEYLYGWLAGYFAADGNISDSIYLDSANLEDLEFVQAVCNRLTIATHGINSKLRQGCYGKGIIHDNNIRRNGRCDLETPTSIFSLSIVGSTLNPEFFLIREHREKFLKKVEDHLAWTVESVEETDRFEEVYCAVVPGTGNFVLHGNILTGNCPVSEPGPNAKKANLEVEGNLDEIDISTEASIDKTASYWDVQQKAKRLRNSGDVKLMQTPQEGLPYIYAYVQGDNGDYHVVIEKDGYKIKGWLCTCRWGDFGPDGPDAAMREENSPYKNRKCSHVLAAAYELQSRNMKNAKLEPFVVQSPNGEKHTIIHVDDDILITDMGQILDGNVIHPNYDSKSGL